MGDSESSLSNNAVASTRAVTRCEWQSLISGWEINNPFAKCAGRANSMSSPCGLEVQLRVGLCDPSFGQG